MSDPTVFVSYSHDDPAHVAWVRSLAEELRKILAYTPIQVIFDQTDLKPGADIGLFMEKGISNADWVLVVCTDAYNDKADNGHGGAGYEKMIMTSELIKNQNSQKFIPIVRNEEGRTPVCLATRLYVDMRKDGDYQSGLQEIANVLCSGQIPTEPPKPKGWSFDPEGKDPLVKGQPRVFQQPDGRIETAMLLDNEVVALEQVFPWGGVAYYEQLPNGTIIRQKWPYPQSEYAIVLNPAEVVQKEQSHQPEGATLHIAVLKWGRSVRWLTDAQKTLLDYHIVGPYELNHAHKEIRVGWLQ